MSWITSLKKWALAPTVSVPIVQSTAHCMVQAPVLGFVRTVKASPRRFRARPTDIRALEGRHSWMSSRKIAVFEVTDKQEDVTFIVLYLSGRLYTVEGIDFALNGWELNYLHEQLSPVFMRAVQRREGIRSLWGKRVREALEADNKQKRDKWTAIYGE